MRHKPFSNLIQLDQLPNLALALALAWASGIRLYAVLFLVGLARHFHWFDWDAPTSFELLSHPLVLGTTGFMLFIEFFADKIPGVDTIWDVIHTFVRIPAGALLAAGVIGAGDGPAWALAAGLLGGTITAGTHLMKAGGRTAINTSPEPVSNWTASFTEDAAVLGGLWLAIQQPLLFLILLGLFVLTTIWMLPKLYRFIRAILNRIATMFTSGTSMTAR